MAPKSPVDFWLWRYLNVLLYWSVSFTLTELNDAIQKTVLGIHPDMLSQLSQMSWIALFAPYNVVDDILNNFGLNKSLKV